jgi:hypothetical protein
MSAAAHPHTIGTRVVVIRDFEYYGRPSDPFNATVLRRAGRSGSMRRSPYATGGPAMGGDRWE